MHPDTSAILRQLDGARWFSRVGKVDGVEVALVLRSWEEAIARLTSTTSQELNWAAANHFCSQILERSKERYDRLGGIIDDLKKITVPMVGRKIDAVVRENKLPEAFEAKVHIDVIHYCLEAEFADLVKPAWFTGHASWYAAGHLPCGWEGKLPQGRIVIY